MNDADSQNVLKHLKHSVFKWMLDGSIQWSLTITVVFFKSTYLSLDYTAEQIKLQKGSIRA